MNTYIVHVNPNENGYTEYRITNQEGKELGAKDKMPRYFDDQVGLSSKAVQSVVKNLAGKVFTLLDASIQSEKQLKAMKDIVRNHIADTHCLVEEICYGSQITQMANTDEGPVKIVSLEEAVGV